jgi:hypothetical protein
VAAEDRDDRAEILATLEEFFTREEADEEELVGGPLLVWMRYPQASSWYGRYEHRRTLESAEIRELDEQQAVVEIRAGETGSAKRGSGEYAVRYDGPAVLARIGGRWRIVDYMVMGRRRLEAIVLGPLAEQEQAGITVRVLGVDRGVRYTRFAVELANAGETEARFDQAYALFETTTAWSRLGHDRIPAVEPGGATTTVFASNHVLDLADPVFGISFRIRAGGRKLPFLLKVPLAKPEQLDPQPPPRMLPLLRRSVPRSLLFYGLVAVALAFWQPEVAVIVPLSIVVAVYAQIRAGGGLPERLYRVRYLLDALVAVAVFAALWEFLTPVAVPAAVGALVYLLLWRFARRRRQLRLLAAFCVAFAWLFLLGASDGRLSPCRLADGTRTAAADDAVREAMRTGKRAFSAEEVDAFVAHGRSADSPYCYEGGGGRGRCYQYDGRVRGKRLTALAFVACDGSSWRAESFYLG